MWVTIFLFFQLQPQLDPVRPSDVARLSRERHERALEQQRHNYEIRSKRDFEERFNKLVKALEEFTQEYNGGTGNVWPHKKAIAVEKAIKGLQTSQTWKERAADNK